MSMNGMINCKVKLLSDGEFQEMRRFTLDDTSFASNFDLFKEKLRAVFPQLRGNVIKLTWTDSDNDVITIANDEDLVTAMMEMDGVKLLEVSVPRPNTADDDEQDDEGPMSMPAELMYITCDVCHNRITRYRYKCLQCPDYDLCMNCEQAGNHAHHIMMRLANLEIPRCLPKIMSHMGRSARKAAHHAAREAHKTARTSFRAAQAATKEFRCPRGAPGRYGQHARPGSSPAECPAMAGNGLFDMAESFLGQFLHAQGQGATNPQGPATSAPASASGAPPGGEQPKQQQQQQGTAEAQGATVPPTPPAEVLGNVLRNIFSAINANLAQGAEPQPQGATPASTGTTTPTPFASAKSGNNGVASGSPIVITPTPVAAQTQTPTSTPFFNPKEPIVCTSGGVTRTIPMEVEGERQLYPNIPTFAPAAPASAPDAGWTFVSAEAAQAANAANGNGTPRVVPVSPAFGQQPTAPPLKPEDAKYAEGLQQLRKMGFSESVDLLGLLRLYNGNIGAVVNHLFEAK